MLTSHEKTIEKAIDPKLFSEYREAANALRQCLDDKDIQPGKEIESHAEYGGFQSILSERSALNNWSIFIYVESSIHRVWQEPLLLQEEGIR